MPTVLMLLDFVPNQQRTFESFLLRLTHQLLKRSPIRKLNIFLGKIKL